MSKNPFVMVVLDGFGFSKNKTGNAVAMAKTPNLDFFEKNYPYALLQASGVAVGLEWGEPGNSEVGHLALGAGRFFKHYLPIINSTINDKSFFSNDVLLKALKNAEDKKSKLHIIGLLTSGSVHASIKHLTALIDLAKKQPLKDVYLHLFTDGKDSRIQESVVLLKKIQNDISGTNIKIATIIGRDFAMNRNNEWQKTQKAYDLIVEGMGTKTDDFIKTLAEYHQSGITDESIPPTVSADLPVPLISSDDSLIFFNFREDSIKQLAKTFAEKNFSFLVSFTRYLEGSGFHHIFPPIEMKNNLAEWLSSKGKTQFHIAESEKYAHITYFFNGLKNQVYNGETDIFLKSPTNLADAPEMRSADIAQRVVTELKREHYDFFLINFANADMLSHLGNIDLVVRGIEKIDEALGIIFEETKKQNGVLIITSDHGNAEALIYSVTGERETKHNSNPVPFYLVSEKFQGRTMEEEDVSGVLLDVAPTVLEIMEIPKPAEMTGQSLLKNLSSNIKASP